MLLELFCQLAALRILEAKNLKSFLYAILCFLVGVLVLVLTFYLLPLGQGFRYQRFVGMLGGIGVFLIAYSIWSFVDRRNQ